MSIMGSNDKSNMEGRRPKSLLTAVEAGGNEGVSFCERWFRRGGARGPPGMVGGLIILIGLEIIDGDSMCLDDGESNFPFPEIEDKEPEDDDISRLFGLSFLDRLAFRPNEAKNPALFEMGVEGVKERIEGGAPTLELDRDGLVPGGFMAKDGYGRVRDTEVGVISL